MQRCELLTVGDDCAAVEWSDVGVAVCGVRVVGCTGQRFLGGEFVVCSTGLWGGPSFCSAVLKKRALLFCFETTTITTTVE